MLDWNNPISIFQYLKKKSVPAASISVSKIIAPGFSVFWLEMFLASLNASSRLSIFVPKMLIRNKNKDKSLKQNLRKVTLCDL